VALIALDALLKELQYDLLIVSGDLSRVGHLDSFSYVKNWLYGSIQTPGGGSIGLNLNPAEKRCFVVPGNHDCFNENLRQHSLTNYHQFFPNLNRYCVKRTRVGDIDVNVHLYDSTYADGGFAKGLIEPSSMRPWTSDERTLDLAVVHHHLARLPEHKRNKSLELINLGSFVSFLLTRHINGVFFGHTHESFFEKVSAELLRSQMKDERFWRRLLRRTFPRQFSGGQHSTLNFPKIPTRDGRYPSFDKFFEYLYVKHVLGKDINGPDHFDTPKRFHDHVRSFRSDYPQQFREACRSKVAFSMAPSPTYDEADNTGFHMVEFK
jgi:predicted phosphodiesterase